MKKTTLLIGGMLMAVASSTLAANFYKWTDANGTTHYDVKPPQGAQAEQVHTYNSASSDQASAVEKLQKRRQQESKDIAREKRQAAEKQREQDEPDKVAKERCDQHRKNLDILTNKPTVRQKNPDTGEMEVITQEQRDKMLADTRKALKDCEKQGY
ncbi:MAG: DUF4124 domain-containing protein [Alcanivorax sp.]|nr:DUF4124 domain-containing protein [Alcanivorax sp.]